MNRAAIPGAGFFVSGAMLLLLASTLASCTTPPPPIEAPEVHSTIVADYAKRVPVDVAVLPVVDRTGTELPILDLVRNQAVQELAKRLYSPLDRALVDAQVDSHFRSTPYDIDRVRNRMGEDAVLAISITEFDTSYLPAHGKVRMGGTFELFDSADGRLLWSRKIEKKWIEIPGRIEPGALRPAEKSAVRDFVRFAFEDLPKKSVVGVKP